MADKVINVRISQKIDTTEAWNQSNLVLKNGEIGFEQTPDNQIKAKIGDGTNLWKKLPYFTEGSSVGDKIDCGTW